MCSHHKMPRLYIELRNIDCRYKRRPEVPDVPAIVEPPIIVNGEIQWGDLVLTPELYYPSLANVEATSDRRFLLVTDDRSLIIYHASGTIVYEGDYNCQGGSEITNLCPVDIIDQTAGEDWWKITVSNHTEHVLGTIGTEPFSDDEDWW
jgi:hypothetical protein